MASAISTGSLAVGTTLVVTGRSFLNAIQAFTDGTNAVTVSVYDNIVGSGTLLGQIIVPGTTLHNTVSFRMPPRGDNGLTIVVSGTGGTAIVHHSAGG